MITYNDIIQTIKEHDFHYFSHSNKQYISYMILGWDSTGNTVVNITIEINDKLNFECMKIWKSNDQWVFSDNKNYSQTYNIDVINNFINLNENSEEHKFQINASHTSTEVEHFKIAQLIESKLLDINK